MKRRRRRFNCIEIAERALGWSHNNEDGDDDFWILVHVKVKCLQFQFLLAIYFNKHKREVPWNRKKSLKLCKFVVCGCGQSTWN